MDAETREEIVAQAIGDQGNTTRGHKAIDALHDAGFRIQRPPSDAEALILSLRERGQFADADMVEALALELDHMRRGWGPSTPTERMLRRADLISTRRFLEHAYQTVIELNLNNYTHDDVCEANNGAIEAIQELTKGIHYINDKLQVEIGGIVDRNPIVNDAIFDATRAVS